jgi:AcrR family transcriptional regulator
MSSAPQPPPRTAGEALAAAGPRKRLADARRAIYRTTILDAAEREFAQHGYDATKVQAIARTACVSLATLYATFPKKWDIYRALHQERLDALMQQVGARVLAARDAFARLRGGLEGYMRFHMEHPDFLRVQLKERVPWGTTDRLRSPEQTRAWEAGLQMMIAAFAEGMRSGVFVEDDPEVCARTATAMSQVRLALWVDRRMEDDKDAVARAAMLQFVRTFVRPERVAELAAVVG